jgi:hypothetical protein
MTGTGCWVRQYDGAVNVKWFGAIGDGVSDDANAIQAAFDLAEHKELAFPGSGIYVSTNTINMPVGCTLNLNGSTLTFKIIGMELCLVVNDRCTVRNGVVSNTTSDTTVYGAEYQQPIVIGRTNSITNHLSNILIENLTVFTKSPGGNCVFVYGWVTDTIIQDIYIPPSSLAGEPIGAHWSTDGVDAANGTKHPNNITFKNITVGAMTYADSAATCYLSSVGKVNIDNLTVEGNENGYGVIIFAGDKGYQYNGNLESEDTCKVTITNSNIKANTGFFTKMQDDLGTVWDSKIKFTNCNFLGQNKTDPDSAGVSVGHNHNTVFENCTIDGFYTGVLLRTEAINLTLNTIKIVNNLQSAVRTSSIDCKNIRINDAYFAGNCTLNATTIEFNILHDIDGVYLNRCIFNSSNTYRVLVTSSTITATNIEVTDCRVEQCTSTAFVFGTSAMFGICTLFANNYVNPSLAVNIKGGQAAVPFNRFSTRNSQTHNNMYMLDTAPNYGTYAVGDIVYNDTPLANGAIGWVCVTAGTPGTWKTFGTISA